MPGTILVVDDDRGIRDVIRLALEERGYEIIDADDGETGLAQFCSVLPDLSILDVGLPGAYDGVELLRKIHDDAPGSPRAHHQRPGLARKGRGSDEAGRVRLSRQAAESRKALDPHRARAGQRAQGQRSSSAPAKREKATFGFDRLIGGCPPMQEVISTARKVATVPFATVLLTGDSGTGKELVAHAIHLASANAKEPFVEVNCAAMPETLLEAELFGYEKGAFTDAKQRKRGLAGNGRQRHLLPRRNGRDAAESAGQAA